MGSIRLYLTHIFVCCVFVLSSIFLHIGTAKAATFCVSNATELQDALTIAVSNGEDDVVHVAQVIMLATLFMLAWKHIALL